jgi:pimeloyl-ACP methyl ester carboxylesterase
LFVILALAAISAVLWTFTRLSVVAIDRTWPPMGSMVEAAGLDVHVVDLPGPPGAPTLVLLHGASGNLREPLEALRGPLGARFRVIAIDRPGHGYTSRGGRDMANPARQADIVAAVLGKLGAEPAIVLGYSWGASVAAALGVHHPGSVAGLVLVAPATHPWPGSISARSRFFSLPQLGRAVAEMVVVPLGLLIAPLSIRAVFSPDPVPEEYATRIGALLAIRPRTFVANANDVAELRAHVIRLSPHYPEIAAPTEVVTADIDPVVSPAIHAFGLARDIPGARLTVTRGGGHMLHWTRTAEVVDAIDRAAARVGPQISARLHAAQ